MFNMSKIVRISKKFTLEMAHVLYQHKGPCKNMHGHSYQLYVLLKGKPDAHSGMLIDFSELDKYVYDNIIQKYDHTLVLYKDNPLRNDNDFNQLFPKTIYVDFEPTAENFVIAWAHALKPVLPEHVKLSGIRLYETAHCFAEYLEDDN